MRFEDLSRGRHVVEPRGRVSLGRWSICGYILFCFGFSILFFFLFGLVICLFWFWTRKGQELLIAGRAAWLAGGHMDKSHVLSIGYWAYWAFPPPQAHQNFCPIFHRYVRTDAAIHTVRFNTRVLIRKVDFLAGIYLDNITTSGNAKTLALFEHWFQLNYFCPLI